MPQFSKSSKKKLATAHQDLQVVFNEVIKHIDCTIVCGERGQKEQDKAYIIGNSQLKYPRSKHNKQPSMAVDVVPFPIDWEDHERFREFAWFVKGVAIVLKRYGAIDNDIKWGGDWKWKDLPHYEL